MPLPTVTFTFTFTLELHQVVARLMFHVLLHSLLELNPEPPAPAHRQPRRIADLCVSDDGKAFRCFLDAQGRAMYVVTRQQFVRRQSELSDEQLQTLWRTALDVVEQQHRAEGGTAPDLFVDIRINSGSFQNIAHLHLKVWMHEPLFEAHWSTNAVYEKLIGEGTITGRHGVRGLQKAA